MLWRSGNILRNDVWIQYLLDTANLKPDKFLLIFSLLLIVTPDPPYGTDNRPKQLALCRAG